MELILSCIAIASFGLVSAIIEAMIETEPQSEKRKHRERTRNSHNRS